MENQWKFIDTKKSLDLIEAWNCRKEKILNTVAVGWDGMGVDREWVIQLDAQFVKS